MRTTSQRLLPFKTLVRVSLLLNITLLRPHFFFCSVSHRISEISNTNPDSSQLTTSVANSAVQVDIFVSIHCILTPVTVVEPGRRS